MKVERIFFLIVILLRFLPVGEKRGVLQILFAEERMGLLQSLNVELKSFGRGLRNTGPFSKIVNGIPPSSSLQKKFPELIKGSIGRGPPSSSLEHTCPGFVKLEAENITSFCLKDSLEAIDQNFFKVLPGKSLPNLSI